ncbi:MAG: phytanoyl-CoA dioxygenase family protein [Pseudomonadota bacterium]
MSVELKHFDISDDWQSILSQIESDGGVIVENFIPEELRLRIIEELKPHADGFEPGVTGGAVKQIFGGFQTKRFTGLPTKSPSFVHVIDHDLMHEWAEQSFNSDYWLNTAQAMIVGPGSPAQMLHRDVGNWPLVLSLGKDGPEGLVSILLAISDFTLENGATQVVPGSHKWDNFDIAAQGPDSDQITQAVMPAGSALMYTGKTIHGAGENSSDDVWRFGIHMSFTLGELTPEEALPVTVPWDVAKNFSERVQHMLGYFSHRTFLPDWPILWTSNYRDIRESLEPPASGDYVSSGARTLGAVDVGAAEDVPTE